MKHYLEETKVVLDGMKTQETGLSEQEAAKRLEENGKNKLAEGKKESLIKRFLKQLAEPMTIILIVAAIISAGVEIYNDLGSNLDCLVAGVGTGGTITGTSRFLKEKINGFKAFGVEPSESAVLSGENKGAHGIQGIGAGFIPKGLDLSVLDGVIKVSTKTAIETAKELSSLEGLSVGISSGASVAGAIEVIKNNNFTSVLTILPDGASKYLSTELFN